MKYIKGHNRKQLVLFPQSMDQAIGQDNEVRLIDWFVESLDMQKMGFVIEHIENGRPAYHPKDLLKTPDYIGFNVLKKHFETVILFLTFYYTLFKRLI